MPEFANKKWVTQGFWLAKYRQSAGRQFQSSLGGYWMICHWRQRKFSRSLIFLSLSRGKWVRKTLKIHSRLIAIDRSYIQFFHWWKLHSVTNYVTRNIYSTLIVFNISINDFLCQFKIFWQGFACLNTTSNGFLHCCSC